jgi:hypothetical protein
MRTSFATNIITICLLIWLIVDGRAGKDARNVQETGTNLAPPSVSQTASPTITVNNGKAGWNRDVPHTVNEAADYLNRTFDTVRSYIPRWIESGIPIEKTQGGMWILPPDFEPYIPE